MQYMLQSNACEMHRFAPCSTVPDGNPVHPCQSGARYFGRKPFFWGGDLIKIVCLSTKYESVPEDLTKLTFTSFSFVCPHFVTLLAITYEL